MLILWILPFLAWGITAVQNLSVSLPENLPTRISEDDSWTVVGCRIDSCGNRMLFNQSHGQCYRRTGGGEGSVECGSVTGAQAGDGDGSDLDSDDEEVALTPKTADWRFGLVRIWAVGAFGLLCFGLRIAVYTVLQPYRIVLGFRTAGLVNFFGFIVLGVLLSDGLRITIQGLLFSDSAARALQKSRMMALDQPRLRPTLPPPHSHPHCYIRLRTSP